MSSIRAVVVDDGLKLARVEAPVALPSQAIVQVQAISLNRGEVRRSLSAAKGWRPGWDLAGTVVQAAQDGSGPAHGSRVVGTVPEGAWAEQVAVPTHALAVLPEGVSFAQAATLPIAGLTVLRALEKGGSLLKKRVLITGASGGTGQFAVQLAKIAGAYVVGTVTKPERREMVRTLGAHEVIVGEDLSSAQAYGPYDVILDSVGGKTLAQVLTMLAQDGVCVNFGVSGESSATIDVSKFFLTGGATFYGFIIFYELTKKPAAPDLLRLAQMIADGQLRPQIDVEAPIHEIESIAQQLIERKYAGKAVLHFEY